MAERLLQSNAASSQNDYSAPPMVIPEDERVSIVWRDVNYRLSNKRNSKSILQGISGSAEPGQLTAILGPSGSGKTSLLNVLAGRIPQKRKASITGEVLLRVGTKITFSQNKTSMPLLSAYVDQDDALFALSTVRETFDMVARLRLAHLSREDQLQRVEDVLAELGLTDVADTIVGSDLPGQRGVSGGERKRVSLGCELLHRPRLLLMDEPTSGLDSFQALQVANTLSTLARMGHTVICSIHQPRSSIYGAFDKLVLLANGRTVYCGPAGALATYHFTKLGYSLPPNFNPADHFLDVISVDQRPQFKAASMRRVRKIIDAFEDEYKSGKLEIGTEGVEDNGRHSEIKQVEEEIRSEPPGFSVVFPILVRRTWKELTRDILAIVFKQSLSLFFTLMFGFVYWRMPFNQTSFQDRTGILFFFTMNYAFGATIGTAQVIPRQLKVVTRERAAKLYSVLPFYLANFVCTLPFETIPQLIFGVVTYYMTNLRHGVDHLFYFVGVLILENLCGIGLGMLMSAIVSKVEIVPQVAPAVTLVFLMFSGYFLNEESIPRVFLPLKYVSFIRYAFQALCVNEFRDADYFSCEDAGMGRPCLQGNQFLAGLNFLHVKFWGNVGILIAITAALHLLAFLVLCLKRPRFLKLRDPTPLPSSPAAGASSSPRHRPGDAESVAGTGAPPSEVGSSSV